MLAAGGTYIGGSTGGEAAHLLKGNEMPAGIQIPYGNSGGAKSVFSGEVVYTSGVVNGYATVPTNGGEAHNNMPPYLAVYMWKRVA